MDAQTRRALIERYKDGYRAVTEALQGISERELDARPAPGKWSAREIVHHLADSEMTSAIRLRRLIAEDRPLIQGYDQDEYARRLYYDRPIHASLEALRSARETTTQILERMPEAQWAREGTHSESGRYTAERWLEIYAQHAHNHADQIRRARSAAK
ncbi:MAG TPA: DinB family protein [Candidatus Methylomirabilis sp.]|nr:DinB family protein [Candidatus Methylomirabilis sp.]